MRRVGGIHSLGDRGAGKEVSREGWFGPPPQGQTSSTPVQKKKLNSKNLGPKSRVHVIYRKIETYTKNCIFFGAKHQISFWFLRVSQTPVPPLSPRGTGQTTGEGG